MSKSDILALVAIVLIISAFAYYAYQQYTFSRTGRVILVEYRASKAWRKGDAWYFQSQSFSAGHVVSHNIYAVFKISSKEAKLIRLSVEAQDTNYIEIAAGKQGLCGYAYITGGKHVVEVLFNETTVVKITVDSRDAKIEEYSPWGYKGYTITVFTSSNKEHVLIVKFLEIKP